MSSLSIAIIFAFLVVVAGISSYQALGSTERAIRQRYIDVAMRAWMAHGGFGKDEVVPEGFARAAFQWAIARLPAPKTGTPRTDKIASLLVQAGLSGPTALRTFYLIRTAAAVAGGVIGVLAGVFGGACGSHRMLYLIVGAGVGAFAPNYVLARMARSRQTQISRQLSDVLDLLVVCVEAGLGLHESIKVVGAEAARHGQAIGRELNIVAGEIQAGKTLGQALRGLSERTAVEDIKPLAATLIQSEQLGAQIAPALRSSSDTLRARRRLRAEETAQKITVKMLFPLVLFILPAMMAVIVGPAMSQILNSFHH